jgi:folate-dependent phosphoribosylglycinamide formyltransferase PurN
VSPARGDGARLVVLTADGPEHRYVATRLCRELPIGAVLVDVTARRPSLRRAFRGGARRGLSRLALHAFQRAVRDDRAHDRAMQRVLGAAALARGGGAERVIEVEGINSAAAVAALDEIRPHAVLVFGTAIVHDTVLGRAEDLAFNMHTGLSPRYRGTDCAFWPLVNREPECIGATVHECTSAVDGGQIFAKAAARIEPGDGVHEAFARAVARGAELYVDVLRDYLAGHLAGERQDLTSGTEYRGYMRTLLPELRARWTLRRLPA